MDTPDRSKVGGAPLSNKFEDSPVFSFINSLSPIQPVKSTYGTSSVQAYQPLSFSIFTSPHTNLQKPSRPPLRNDVTEVSTTEVGPNNCTESSTQPNAQNALPAFESTKINPESSTKCLLNEADKCTGFDAGSPDHNTTYRTLKTNFRPDTNEAPSQRKNLFASETVTHGEGKDEVMDCDWDYLLCGNPGDILICDPTTEGEDGSDKLADGGALSCSLLINSTQPSGGESHVHLGDTNQSPDMLVSCPNETGLNGEMQEKAGGGGDIGSMAYKEETPQQRGMRRRCLVFDPSISLTSRSKMVSDGPKSRKAPAVPALPGIGLHLNSLTAVSKDALNVGNMSVHQSQTKLLVACDSLECTTGAEQETSLFGEESSLAIVAVDAIEPPNSPKKRRRKAESGDGDACKRCSCKKSKCLKLYCECFAAGVYCSEPCACQGCFNKPIHEETVLATRKQIEFRNPLAFAPKVIRTSESGIELGEESNNTPASARHKRGCNCKKSGCLKKYCECFQGGVGCSASCRCESCKNTFGRREEFVQEGEEGHGGDKEEEGLEDGQEKARVQNFDPHAVDLHPITPPFETCGTLVKLPCYSSGKPPKPTYTLPTVISSGLYTSCSLINLKDLTNPASCGENEDTPDRHLINKDSPHGGVTKTSSPNGKRVSPPHTSTGPSPTRKGGRKLILKSIPSFPSLAGDGFTDCFGNNQKSGSFCSTSITRGP